MDKGFRFDSGYLPSVATAPTILMPSLLDSKNPSNMRIPSECHLTLSDTVDYLVDPLLLEDLPIARHSDKKAKASNDAWRWRHWCWWTKETWPWSYTHDIIHVDDIMEHGSSPIHYELIPSLPGHQAFPLVKLKTTNGNTYGHAYHFCKSSGGRTWLYISHQLIMGRNWYATLVLNTSDDMKSNLMWNYLLCILHFVL